MKVFTTVFMAHPQSADHQRVYQPNRLEQDEYDLSDLEQAIREQITVLESSNWFVGEGFDGE